MDSLHHQASIKKNIDFMSPEFDYEKYTGIQSNTWLQTINFKVGTIDLRCTDLDIYGVRMCDIFRVRTWTSTPLYK